jgi:hypothetical protein
MLRMMENLVDRHIRDKILGLCPTHRYQFAYQTQKSNETTLHPAITHIEEAVENREDTLGAFLDIEETFNSTSFDILTKAAERHGLRDTIWRWIGSMLGGRNITATLAGETLEESVARGCLQERFLAPLLWSLDVDKLIRGLKESGSYTLGYTDDIAILISRKFPNTV